MNEWDWGRLCWHWRWDRVTFERRSVVAHLTKGRTKRDKDGVGGQDFGAQNIGSKLIGPEIIGRMKCICQPVDIKFTGRKENKQHLAYLDFRPSFFLIPPFYTNLQSNVFQFNELQCHQPDPTHERFKRLLKYKNIFIIS